jgi:threonine/homoserine/homoserine lactone efflux protein
MAGSAIAAFLAVDLLLVLTPGADWAYAIAAGLGGRSVPAAVGGLVAGYAGYTVLVVTGVAVLVARTRGLLTGLTIAGAGYLMWLGAGTLARRRAPAPAPPASSPAPAAPASSPASSPATGPGDRARWRAAVRGAAVSGLNPKGLLLYLALLPQFARPGAGWPIAAQIGLLGVLHMTDCAVVYSAVGTLARGLLRGRAAAARTLTLASGAVMIALGAALLVERLAQAGIIR